MWQSLTFTKLNKTLYWSYHKVLYGFQILYVETASTDYLGNSTLLLSRYPSRHFITRSKRALLFWKASSKPTANKINIIYNLKIYTPRKQSVHIIKIHNGTDHQMAMQFLTCSHNKPNTFCSNYMKPVPHSQASIKHQMDTAKLSYKSLIHSHVRVCSKNY